MDKQRIKGVITLFGIVLLLGGIYNTYTAFTYETAATTEVNATVVESHVEVRESPPSQGGDSYDLFVRYRYEYGGTTYNSTRLAPGPEDPSFEDRSSAREALRKYEEGSTITAYVDADDPATSRVLSANPDEGILGGALMAVMGLLITVLIGSSYLLSALHPGPEEVDPDRGELLEQFLEAFDDVEEYPVENVEEVKRGSLDRSRSFESNDLEFTVRDLERFVESDPEPPCENAEELAEYVLSEMDDQGYFLR